MKLKKQILLIFALGGVFFASKQVLAVSPFYDNPGQGIFQCHANDKVGNDYLKGGGVVVNWAKLEKKEGEIDQGELGRLVSLLNRGSKNYLHFKIYGSDERVLPSWLNAYDQDKGNDLIEIVNDGWGVFPAPWGVNYQTKLKNFLERLSKALEDKGVLGKVEYIEFAAGGYWGTTHLWLPDDRLKKWAEAAGCGSSDWNCLGARFTEGVNKVADIYMEAFPKQAMMLIGGSCKYSGCNYTGIGYLLQRYGMRLMMKSAGLGARESQQCGLRNYLTELCGGVEPKTKCGEEPWGPSILCSGNQNMGFDLALGCGYYQTYMSSLSKEKISYFCLYSQEIGCSSKDASVGKSVDEINRIVAGKVGAQIYLDNFRMDSQERKIGESLGIEFVFRNDGSTSLIAPLKKGEKWEPSSYKIFVELEKNGRVVYYKEVDPSVSSVRWMPGGSYKVTTQVPLGGEEGTYSLYAGLTDPNGERQRFVLRNSDSKNDLTKRRYLLTDSFILRVSGREPPGRNLGNANGDMVIDEADFNLWLEQFRNGRSEVNCADFNDDGKVDGVDFEIWRRSRWALGG